MSGESGKRDKGGSGMEPLAAGDPRLIGPYRLLGRLGSGGMGRVYLARSEGGRTVAVKVVHEEHAQDPQFRARFRREIEAVRKVGEHYTAPVLDADPEAERPWVATGFVPGPSLEQVVRDHGPLPADSILALADGLLRALQGIHGAGILHRDLKPSNVMLTVEGPRVIDFGIARALERSVESLLTSTGMVVGSPGFMAPEQVRGGSLGPAADVFALGCVLMYAATGRLPFGHGASNQHAIMFQIVEAEPELDRIASEPLRAFIGRCLIKDPAARPGVEALLADAALTGGEAGGAEGGAGAEAAEAAGGGAGAEAAEAAGGGAGAEAAEAAGGGAGAEEAQGAEAAGGAGAEAARGAEAAGGAGAEGGRKASDALAGGDWLPPALVARLARQAARLLDIEALSEELAQEARDAEAAEKDGAPDTGTLGLRPQAGGSTAAPREPRRASRIWAVVAAVFVVLGVSGTVVKLIDNDPGTRDLQGAPGTSTTAPPATTTTGGPSTGAPSTGASTGTGPAPTQAVPPPGGAAGAGGAVGGGGGSSSSGGAVGGGSSSGGTVTSGGGSSTTTGGSGGTTTRPPATTTAPKPKPKPPATTDNRIPSAFVGTWKYTAQFNIDQPGTVYIYRVAPGQIAAKMVMDSQSGLHCEHVAKLISITDGGSRINLGTAVMDRARSNSLCQDDDPSYFALATPTGLRHDVGPAHGEGYHYERAS
ncbi:serine/threonine-protein kinase [Streptomyces sp. NPDC094032]|uniref:serine/threonine-protein kinase n=1 Tax=Streptomyces sp. NPDC094032 TaxID=3155308 RepID=UPI0033212C90